MDFENNEKKQEEPTQQEGYQREIRPGRSPRPRIHTGQRPVAAIVHVRTTMRVAISSVPAMVSPVRAVTSLVKAVISLVSRASMVSVRVAISSVPATVSPVRVAMASSARAAISSVPATVSLVRVATILTMAISPVMVSLTEQHLIRKVPVSIRPTTIRMQNIA